MNQTTRQRVRRILEESQLARNSYKFLLYSVYQEIAQENGEGIFIPFDLFKKLPSPESISREARLIQNTKGESQPDTEIRKHRDIKEVEFREVYGR